MDGGINLRVHNIDRYPGEMVSFTEPLDSEGQRLLAVWNASAPPVRPSDNDVELYAQSWKGGKGSKVLIQGVTPELVDLALRQKASRIVAMDQSRSAFPAMRQLGCLDWTQVEICHNDWRVFVPALKEKLDLVLGDGTLTLLVFPAEWEQVLDCTRRYLVPGGRIILRLSFQPEEPFDIDLYMKETLSCFDRKCSAAKPEQRLGLLREVISEIRIAFGLATAGASGVVDLHRRAELVRFFHAEFNARYGHWKEWEIVRIAMPPEVEVRKGNRVGKGVPRWSAAVDVIEACGFRIAVLNGRKPSRYRGPCAIWLQNGSRIGGGTASNFQSMLPNSDRP